VAKEFDAYKWLNEVAEEFTAELQKVEANEVEDQYWSLLHNELDRAVIYYSDAVAIINAIGFFSGYDENEYYPFKNISQLAYAGLYEYASEKLELKTEGGISVTINE
jgi:hypothetical protein